MELITKLPTPDPRSTCIPGDPGGGTPAPAPVDTTGRPRRTGGKALVPRTPGTAAAPAPLGSHRTLLP